MRFFTTLIFVLISTIIFAQKSNFDPNQFNNPFKRKIDTTAAPSVIRPNAISTLRSNQKSAIFKKGETFFVKVDKSSFTHLRTTGGEDIAITYLRNQFSLDENYSFEKVNE